MGRDVVSSSRSQSSSPETVLPEERKSRAAFLRARFAGTIAKAELKRLGLDSTDAMAKEYREAQVAERKQLLLKIERKASRLKLLEVEKNAHLVADYWPEFKGFQVDRDFQMLISGQQFCNS